MKRIRAFSLALLMGGISASHGATLYVSPSGTASVPYSSWATAANTIPNAANLATNSGDVVFVTNGVYDTGSYATPLGDSLSNRVVATASPTKTLTSGRSRGG